MVGTGLEYGVVWDPAHLTIEGGALDNKVGCMSEVFVLVSKTQLLLLCWETSTHVALHACAHRPATAALGSPAMCEAALAETDAFFTQLQ
jgi:hypothetical protein